MREEDMVAASPLIRSISVAFFTSVFFLCVSLFLLPPLSWFMVWREFRGTH